MASSTTTTTLEDPYRTNVSYQQQWKEYLTRTTQPHIVIYDVLVIVVPGGSGSSAKNSSSPTVEPDEVPTTTKAKATRGRKKVVQQQQKQPNPPESSPSTVIVLASGSNGTVCVWEAPELMMMLPNKSSDEENESGDMEWHTINDTNEMMIGPSNSTSTPNNGGNEEMPSYLLHPKHVWKLVSSYEGEANGGRAALRKMQIVPNSAISNAKNSSNSQQSSSGQQHWYLDSTLYVASDQCGILVYNLHDLFQYGDSIKPIRTYKPQCMSCTRSAFVRDFVVWDNRLMVVVQGDDLGLYQWDISTQAPIHVMAPLPPPPSLLSSHRHVTSSMGAVTSICPTSKGWLLLGTDKGLVGSVDVDGHVNKWIEPVIPLKDLMPSNLSDIVVTSVMEVDQYWWVVAGECCTTTTTNATSTRIGFLASSHVPTQSLLKVVQMRDIPHKLWLHKNSSKNSCRSLISISNTSVVRFWHPITLEPQRENWCMASSSSIPSCYAVTTTLCGINGTVVLVGGVGHQLEVFHQSTRILALSCQSPNEHGNVM